MHRPRPPSDLASARPAQDRSTSTTSSRCRYRCRYRCRIIIILTPLPLVRCCRCILAPRLLLAQTFARSFPPHRPLCSGTGARRSAMASSEMPLPVPPRTPTPPPDEASDRPIGLGFENQLSPARLGFNSSALSPLSATFPQDRYVTLAPGDSLSQRATPSTAFSPTSATFPKTPASAFKIGSSMRDKSSR